MQSSQTCHGNWIGIGAGGIEAGGPGGGADGRHDGNSVVAAVPLLAAGAAVVATITAVATGMLLNNARAPA